MSLTGLYQGPACLAVRSPSMVVPPAASADAGARGSERTHGTMWMRMTRTPFGYNAARSSSIAMCSPPRKTVQHRTLCDPTYADASAIPIVPIHGWLQPVMLSMHHDSLRRRRRTPQHQCLARVLSLHFMYLFHTRWAPPARVVARPRHIEQNLLLQVAYAPLVARRAQDLLNLASSPPASGTTLLKKSWLGTPG